MRRYMYWILGFVLLLLVNVLVEAVLLPYWNLDNTPKNDIYFQSWWLLVGLWAILGLRWLAYLERKFHPPITK
ncbi:MAG: hypothetical protein HRU41_28635 [Saprospiraceae bacterium]|nr:hypothetical protein [Saprospiraceae bacterium]